MRYGQGKGPILIAAELKDRGIKDFDLSIYDWLELAKHVRRKKFGLNIPADYKEKAKQKRFLRSRGFNLDQINKAFLEQI
jgi:regulatory protein